MAGSGVLEVGLISCGGMARVLARALNGLERARIAQVCDADAAAAQDLGQQLGVPWTTRVEEVLANPRLGAVIVATPNHTHADIVVQAAQAGKHIFCEKPLALSVADCDRMIAAARRAGTYLCVGHVLRYLPVFHHIKGLLDQGVIGRPFAVRITRVGGWGAHQPWRQRRATSGGPLFEINVHELDYMRYVLGEPLSVYATGSQAVVTETDFEDTVFAHFRFAGGGHGVLHSSIGSALNRYTGLVQGTEGTLAFTNGPGHIEWRRVDGARGTLSAAELTAPEAHARELLHLVEAALDDRPPPIAGEDGRAAVAMAEAAVASIQSGRVVPVAAGGELP